MKPEPMANSPVRDERRHAERRPFQGTIEIDWGSTTLTGTVRDIGPRGLFVELLPPLWVGARFLARVALDPVLPLDCQVRRVEPGKGMGISFDVPEESGRVQLDALMASLSKV